MSSAITQHLLPKFQITLVVHTHEVNLLQLFLEQLLLEFLYGLQEPPTAHPVRQDSVCPAAIAAVNLILEPELEVLVNNFKARVKKSTNASLFT